MSLRNNRFVIFVGQCAMGVFMLAAAANGYASGCTVTQDDGGTFTDTSVASCADYYPTTHHCHSNPNLSACKRLHMFFAVDWDKADMINNVHRGVWGLIMHGDVATDHTVPSLPKKMYGASENSFYGLIAAHHAGWRSVEYDAFTTNYNLADPPWNVKTSLGHYADLKGFTDWAGSQVIPSSGEPGVSGSGFLMNTDVRPYELFNTTSIPLYLRDRDGFPKKNEWEAWESLNSFVMRLDNLGPNNTSYDITKEYDFSDVVLVIDPKYAKEIKQFRRDGNGKVINKCIGFCGAFPGSVNKADMLSLLKRIVDIDLVNSLSGNNSVYWHKTIIKLPQIMGGVHEVKQLLGSRFGKVLFAPQPDAGGKMAPKDVLTYIDEWVAEGGGKHIAFWDTAIKSNTHWMGKPFDWDGSTFDEHGARYADLTDYLKQKSGKRSAIWIQDLSGPGGRHGNYYMSYTNYPSDASDLRGDMFSTLYLKYAKNVVITTDRPDIFVQAKRYLKTLF